MYPILSSNTEANLRGITVLMTRHLRVLWHIRSHPSSWFPRSENKLTSGLNSFFESRRASVAKEKDEVVGRAWDIGLLRRKDWNDLHSLWHIVQRELNLIATEKYEERIWWPVRRDLLQDRERKSKESLKNIRVVICERHSAWILAQRLWSMKLCGSNIYDSEIFQEVQRSVEKTNVESMIKKNGRYLPNAIKTRLKTKFGLPATKEDIKRSGSDAVIGEKLEELQESVKGKDSRSRYDIDLTPLSNRAQRYASRRNMKPGALRSRTKNTK